MRVAWTPRARSDLSAIRAYVGEENPRAALQVARGILAATRRLPEAPQVGRPGRVPGTRELVIPGTAYIVAYRVQEARVEILRVLHGARRWPKRL